MLSPKLFTGSSNPELCHKVASELQIEVGDADVKRFSDGEVDVIIADYSPPLAALMAATSDPHPPYSTRMSHPSRCMNWSSVFWTASRLTPPQKKTSSGLSDH